MIKRKKHQDVKIEPNKEWMPHPPPPPEPFPFDPVPVASPPPSEPVPPVPTPTLDQLPRLALPSDFSGPMDFGDAIRCLERGQRVQRAGWNGKGMWLILVPGTQGLTVDEGRPLANAGLAVGTKFNYLPHIDMYTVSGDLVPWLASQTDMLAKDWRIVG